ncbi:hypothetical protein M0657_011887 [Pyricularia oryzae]|nr:hypothetical protein M0657_011887 [Pyricularia oryzae]
MCTYQYLRITSLPHRWTTAAVTGGPSLQSGHKYLTTHGMTNCAVCLPSLPKAKYLLKPVELPNQLSSSLYHFFPGGALLGRSW